MSRKKRVNIEERSSGESSSGEEDVIIPLFQYTKQTKRISKKKEPSWSHIEIEDPITNEFGSLCEPVRICGIHGLIPLKLLQNPEIFKSEIFSNSTWKFRLNERERCFLRTFLPPSLSKKEKDYLVEDMFSTFQQNRTKKSLSYCFGHPVENFVKKLVSGFFHPLCVMERDHVNYLQMKKKEIDRKIFENNRISEHMMRRNKYTKPQLIIPKKVDDMSMEEKIKKFRMYQEKIRQQNLVNPPDMRIQNGQQNLVAPPLPSFRVNNNIVSQSSAQRKGNKNVSRKKRRSSKMLLPPSFGN